ncbi:MAG: V-type ATP synthase subunit E family protein [Thermoplasmata archaeon]|nr:V-type ATP synthase subunit E family protein [Thermoplasmata archaeon]
MIEEIRQQGQRESEEILRAAREEREQMLAEVRAQGEERRKERLRQAEDQAARDEVREIARAELEARKALLQAQKEVLDEVRAAAAVRMSGLEGNDRLLESLVEQNRVELEGGLVRCNERDVKALKRLTGARVEGGLDVLGGFVIEAEAGDRRVDLTFDTFLDGLWEQAVRDVADILWKEG